MAQLTQRLTGGIDKGNSLMVNVGEDNKEPLYPLGFTLINTQTQPKVYPRRTSVTIRPQQFQDGVLVPMNFQAGSGSNLGDNLANAVIPGLDEMAEKERAMTELPK
ncbi:putative DNA double-strand break repair Rad50 ATPase [Gossypium australe]|uniref:Putative DNA double-strand break repair Rad50 ATPase n=1 Tax=Gossypium australe TaxID=47621 RepID=A0A5B6WTD4_9ROSI|nr:putative DNA double-strand break repair Rad50 ATPase [Gossypium australe]